MNPISDNIGVNSLRLGGIQLIYYIPSGRSGRIIIVVNETIVTNFYIDLLFIILLLYLITFV